jgi:hypothetical protein
MVTPEQQRLMLCELWVKKDQMFHLSPQSIFSQSGILNLVTYSETLLGFICLGLEKPVPQLFRITR